MDICRRTFLYLFPYFPKELSLIPFSSRNRLDLIYKSLIIYVYDIYSLEKAVLRYRKSYNISIRKYDIVSGRLYLDKIVLDIDGDNLYDSYRIAVKIAGYLYDNDIKYIPVYTGNKGFHIYIPFIKPLAVSTGDISDMRFAQQSLSLIVDKIITESDVDRSKIDMAVSKSLLHYIRIPNSMRDNGRYAIYLPQDIWSMTPQDIINMSNTPKCYKPETYRGLALDFFVELDNASRMIHVNSSEPLSSTNRDTINITGLNDKRRLVFELLNGVVRPCILLSVLNDEPSHEARTFFVSELMYRMFTEDEIHRLIRMLSWRDYNPKITGYHIRKIFEKKLYPPSCRKLRELGFCLGSRCPFYPVFPLNTFLSILWDINKSNKSNSSGDRDG